MFGLSYGIQTLKLSSGLLLSGVAIGNAVGIVTNPMFGALSDRIGRRPLLGASYFLAALYVLFLFFPLLRTGDPAIVILAMAIPGAILQPMSLAVSGSFYPERFADATLRLSGVSLGRQLGTILGGGLMPMIAASLLAWSGGSLTVGARLLRADLRHGRRRRHLRARDGEGQARVIIGHLVGRRHDNPALHATATRRGRRRDRWLSHR